jgi:hypothetical protein
MVTRLSASNISDEATAPAGNIFHEATRQVIAVDRVCRAGS